MLRVGLTGGIGAGKSTVASRLAEHGALLIDADAIAREVVEPGTPGLAAIVAEFGEDMLAEDGSLNRPAMAARVFNDEAARGRLNGIVHPLIGERTAELFAGAAEDAIVVHDVPLLVENHLAPAYHLVLIVDAPVDVRLRRLAESRGMPEADARARIATQADEQQRRAVADVWLDNSGSSDTIRAEVDALWSERLVPFEANVRLRWPAPWGRALLEHDPAWQSQARRVLDRVRLVAGERAVRADHIGATAVPDVPARDVLDLQLTVRAAEDVATLGPALATAGFPPAVSGTHDAVSDVPDAVSGTHDAVSGTHDAVSDVPDAVSGTHDAVWHGGADPGRPVSLRVLADDNPAARHALLLRDWLRADADARAEYARIKREHAAVPGSGEHAAVPGSGEHAAVPGSGEPAADTGYAQVKQTWLNDVAAKAEHWAVETGWTL